MSPGSTSRGGGGHGGGLKASPMIPRAADFALDQSGCEARPKTRPGSGFRSLKERVKEPNRPREERRFMMLQKNGGLEPLSSSGRDLLFPFLSLLLRRRRQKRVSHSPPALPVRFLTSGLFPFQLVSDLRLARPGDANL